MLSFLGLLAWTPARADEQDTERLWALSTRASVDAGYAAGAGADQAFMVALDGLAGRVGGPRPGSTGGGLRLTAGGAAPGVGATHWSRLRLYGVEVEDDILHVSFSSLDVRHRFEWQGTPTLSSPRTLWRRPYTEISAGVSSRMLGIAMSSWTAELFGLSFDAGQVRQHDGGLAAVQNQVTMEFVFFGVHGQDRAGPDFTLDLLAAKTRGVTGDAWSSLGSFDFLRLQGVRFADTLSADFSIGMAGTSVLPIGVPERGAAGDPPPVATDERPLGSTTAVRGRVQGSRGPVTAALAGHRDAHLTFDGEPALEHRLASELSWSGEAQAVAVEAFAAHTEVWLDTARSERDVTGGVSGTWQRQLRSGWILDLSVEAARSFYASLAEGALPEAGLGARATAQLSRRFTSGR
jgi:hypothetical protein